MAVPIRGIAALLKRMNEAGGIQKLFQKKVGRRPLLGKDRLDRELTGFADEEAASNIAHRPVGPRSRKNVRRQVGFSGHPVYDFSRRVLNDRSYWGSPMGGPRIVDKGPYRSKGHIGSPREQREARIRESYRQKQDERSLAPELRRKRSPELEQILAGDPDAIARLLGITPSGGGYGKL